MQIKVKGKVIYTYSVRRLIYALCFLLFCVINQRNWTTVNAPVYRDLTGTVMAVIILSHYRLNDFLRWKILHLIWTAVWIIGTPIAFFLRSSTILLADWVVIALSVILFGYILICTFISIVFEKRYPKINRKYGAVWLIMMLLMIFSRSEYVWPFCYLVMFGCFYLTDFSEGEKSDLFQGMLDGIILGFFCLQGFCFIFRPYDKVRYYGAFGNSNFNSLFYLIVLAAVFTKLLYVIKNGVNSWVRLYYWVGAGVVLSFELLTIGRTGWLTAVFLVFAFAGFLRRLQENRKRWKTLLALVVSVCVTFPMCFGAVRYLPPLFHHPIWFEGEWNKWRVHSWDPWDSEKYIEFDEYFDAALGRVLESLQNIMEHSPFLLKADAKEAVTSDSDPVLNDTEKNDAILVRSTIYKYYLKQLNFRGHPYSEQGFYLTSTYWVYHAHNIYLQYGTDFGIPVMVLFIILILWGAILLGRRCRQWESEMDACCWMFLMIPAIFGLFECSWGTGSLSILMLFIVWREVVCCEAVAYADYGDKPL